MSAAWMIDRNSDGDAVHLISDCCYETPAHCRAVVVIDLLDRGHIDAIWDRMSARPGFTRRDLIDALREFSNPKPPEPTGLGAIVKDSKGVLWANLADPSLDRHDCHWMAVNDPDRWADYADIKAVRVLSEGVTP